MEQQHQRALWYENYRAALRDDCKAVADNSPGWAKLLGAKLWPGKDPIEAGRTLNDMTNPNRDDRLSDEHERLIMRLSVEKRGYSAAHDYVADEINMERAKPKDRRDEALELQARAERVLAELRDITMRQEKLSQSPLAVVSRKTA